MLRKFKAFGVATVALLGMNVGLATAQGIPPCVEQGQANGNMTAYGCAYVGCGYFDPNPTLAAFTVWVSLSGYTCWENEGFCCDIA